MHVYIRVCHPSVYEAEKSKQKKTKEIEKKIEIKKENLSFQHILIIITYAESILKQ
ncbi:hypothetical protein DOY81_007679 [Sarcophaga bullata]|nr:hypothetical protein DOY81_007679 [Sarcophaga bullata]